MTVAYQCGQECPLSGSENGTGGTAKKPLSQLVQGSNIHV